VPFQLNYDQNLGLNGAGNRTTLNLQPVIPFALDNGANIITRTIIPYVWQEDVIPGTSQQGFGDILFSAWYSHDDGDQPDLGRRPGRAVSDGVRRLGDTWAAGVTAIALQQTGPWTYGALANHLWDLESDPKTPTNATFVQPFVAYSTEDAWTFSLQTESDLRLGKRAWSVPVNASRLKACRHRRASRELSGRGRLLAGEPGKRAGGLALTGFRSQFVF
jgi:hypothetical protein